MYELSEQARLNRKLVFAKTISGSYQFDTILITNEDAVNVLYKSYLSRKEEILPIVHRCDSDVGSDFFTQPYARRLDSAKKASTPWQFNYILRGGWNTVRTLYLSTCPQQRQRLLASAIAAFQILLLDNCVDYNWLCDFFRNIEYSVSWTRTDLLHLVSNRIVLSEDDPRIIHIESAKVILAQFLEGSTPEQAKPLYTAIEKAVVDGIVSPLGLVWIYNGLSSHLIIEIYSNYLITQRMIAFICGNLQGITTPKARLELAFFLDRVFTYNYEKNGFWYFKNNLQLLTAWISESNGETAYAYSRLINSLYNHDKELHHAFSGKINWHTLFTSLAKENGRHLYSWGQLINRLVISLSQVERDTLSIQLETAINMLLTTVTSRNIDEMSSFLASVAYLIPHLIPEIIKTLLPRYKERFIEDASNILYIFDFNFLLYVCGLSLLGGHRATEDEKETSRMLISSIPEKELGKLIANCEPRLWDQFYDVMILVSAYSQDKARKIVENIDLELLSNRATDYWNREHSDVFPLCLSLHLGSRKIAKLFISMNANRILHFSIYYVFVAPTCAIQAFHEGKPVDIISNHNWRLAYFSFKGLLDVDKQTANEILVTNLKRICSEVNELAEVDFEDVYCIKFFRLVQKSNTYSFARILAGLNLERIATHWPKRISFQKTNRGRKKRYRTFLDYLCNLETPAGVREVLEEIRNDLDRNVSSNDYR